MSKHPYPKHVIEAVAKALLKSSEPRNTFGAGGDWEAAGHTIQQEFLDHANTALQALWDASRVDDMAQVDALPTGTLLITSTGSFMSATTMSDAFRWTHLPAHVIFWGDKNE